MQGSRDEAIILAIFRLHQLMKKHTNETPKIKMSMNGARGGICKPLIIGALA